MFFSLAGGPLGSTAEAALSREFNFPFIGL
jgi:hypothetical protein